MEHDAKTDRELLIQAVTDICWIKKILQGHLQHHTRLFFAGLAVVGSLITALVLLAITK